MPDPIDAAQELEERLRDLSLARFREGVERFKADAASLPEERDCALCGSEIPPARIAAQPSADHCVDCQAWLERRRR